MIIQSLVEYYQSLAKNNKVPLSGWSSSNVSFALVLSENGEVLDLVDRRDGNKKKKSRKFIVPEQAKRTSNISPFFLCDNASYLLGLDTKDKSAQPNFLAAKQLHQTILSGIDDPVAQAVFYFFEKWEPEKYQENGDIVTYLGDLKKGANLIFSVNGQYAHECPSIREKWAQYVDETKIQDADGICSVTGERAKIARLHPLIKGVYGAQTAGASLVSFNAEAYTSRGKEQGYNAAISEKVAFKYTTALNYLLAKPTTHQVINDITFVFWTNVAPSNKDSISHEELFTTIEEVAKGRSIEELNALISSNDNFYILGLAPNAARLSVRLFAHNKVSFFANNLLAHQKRLEIVRPKYDEEKEWKIQDLLDALANSKTREKKISPLLAGEIIRAILLDTNYPYSLITALSMRIKAEQEITPVRAALIKAFYLKNKNKKCPEEVLTMSLNEEATDIPYLLGRAFAILERTQWTAHATVQEVNGKQKNISDLNKTIRDKYFNSAASTPSYVFPRLIQLSQHHLNKIRTIPEKKGAAIALEKTLIHILANIPAFPKHLTLPEQGAFQLGYYHQKEAEFQKSELNKGEKNND